MLGAGDNTYRYARQYALCVIVAGGVPTVLSNVLSNLLRSIGRSREAGFGIILGGLLNIALDPLFMFVLLPDGLEVLGAGLATCLSNCVGLSASSSRSWPGWAAGRSSPSARGQDCPGGRDILAVFAVGVPSAVATFLFDMDYVVLDKLMVGYDDLALAAIGIVLKVERFPLNVGIGICQGMMPLAAYNYASGDRRRLADTIRLSRLLGLGIALGSIVLYELFAGPLARLFLEDAETVSLATGSCGCGCWPRR